MLGIGSLSARRAKTNNLKKVYQFFISLRGEGWEGGGEGHRTHSETRRIRV